MVKRALCVALGLVGACLPAVAQQATRPEWPVGAFDPAFAMDLYQPKISGAGDSFLLFRRGPVRPWSDGGWLASENALTQTGMVSLDFFPAAFWTPEVVSGSQTNGVHNSRSVNSGTDGKDLPQEMLRSTPIYSGGEVGFVYGQWSGKGGGNMWETYVVGTVGNDKFQITAGATFDEWNGTGRDVRFRSFAAPR
ncbi:MAG: hypothetical protein WCE87_12015 [Candidatus Udaeobacter sp.]